MLKKNPTGRSWADGSTQMTLPVVKESHWEGIFRSKNETSTFVRRSTGRNFHSHFKTASKIMKQIFQPFFSFQVIGSKGKGARTKGSNYTQDMSL